MQKGFTIQAIRDGRLFSGRHETARAYDAPRRCSVSRAIFFRQHKGGGERREPGEGHQVVGAAEIRLRRLRARTDRAHVCLPHVHRARLSAAAVRPPFQPGTLRRTIEMCIC